MVVDVQGISRLVEEQSAFLSDVTGAIERVIVGQRYMIEGLLIGMLTNGHVLLEGVPGLAKTLTVTTLSQAIDAKFQRIQFTPDLLPADLIGTLIYNPRDGVFVPRKGPIFANIILADEINRAPAKVQSALLEAMQERQVTIGDETYRLDDPFLVLATQNPIEQEGTYPLPEAQVDRFMLKLKITYPSKAEEREVLDRMASTKAAPIAEPVISLDAIRAARSVVDQIFIDDKIKDYVVDVVHATRNPADYGLADLSRLIDYGASPRATIALTLTAKARAFLEGRAYVTPQDVKTVGRDVLRHRVIPSYEAEAEGLGNDDIVAQVFDHVPVP
ncbi:MAG: MoxR family ATPase [Planctomycetes bacterium]|nr:MoxR family ATPase [Planctomycetota bacterium]NOG55829.1 MoxR family ATPase [Planctomycetota bacterium]